MSNEAMLQSLLEAVKVSPNNLPLRKSLAATFAAMGRHSEAADAYRQALGLAPSDPSLKVGLASAFHAQGKHSEAMVVIEDVCRDAHSAPADGLILYARLLLRGGEFQPAARAYEQAVAKDADAIDASLAEQLGVAPEGRSRRETGPSFDAFGEPVGGYDDELDDDDDYDPMSRRVPAAREDAGPDPMSEMEKPKVSFKDVGGMDGLKEEVQLKIIAPLTHPEIYEAYGKKIGGGILMYGPPGCGKTHLARATAGEVKAGFISVGIHDVLDMWIGQSEHKLHELFEQARANTPCVLFFDEVDALGASRIDMRQSAGRQLINQFLSELDGIDNANEGVLILAATNSPWHLDAAFRRPGRFDRILFVPPPDAPARAAIAEILLKDKPTEKLDVEQIAKKTDGFSGADLKAVVDVAIEAKLREAMSKGVPTPLTTKDLLKAAKQIKPSCKEWFAAARNYALYSNQGGIYDDILEFMKLK